jgi:urease accessory protein
MKKLPTILGFILAPVLAHAHPGHGDLGFVPGFAHPLTGIDHVLAMLAVGLWAVQLGGRALWVVPSTFVTVMALGGVLGMNGLSLPAVEQGILASVLILGMMVAAAVRLPLLASAAMVGGFALMHGCAHGVELGSSASAFSTIAGFVLATALIHGAGIALGFGAAKAGQPRWMRFAGGAIATCAILLTLGCL